MLLLDNSAWARLNGPRLPSSRIDEVVDLLVGGELAVCLPFLLEAGYSARTGEDHRTLMRDLTQLPRVDITDEVEHVALLAQGELARVGQHRIPPTDIAIAACAHVASAGVLHYDHDFDRLRKHTSLRFESEWLAAPGRL